jgi:hypothetical protein
MFKSQNKEKIQTSLNDGNDKFLVIIFSISLFLQLIPVLKSYFLSYSDFRIKLNLQTIFINLVLSNSDFIIVLCFLYSMIILFRKKNFKIENLVNQKKKALFFTFVGTIIGFYLANFILINNFEYFLKTNTILDVNIVFIVLMRIIALTLFYQLFIGFILFLTNSHQKLFDQITKFKFTKNELILILNGLILGLIAGFFSVETQIYFFFNMKLRYTPYYSFLNYFTVLVVNQFSIIIYPFYYVIIPLKNIN